MTEPVSITAALDGVVRSLRGPSRAAVGGVFGRWSEVVGDEVACHVRPLQLDECVLVVEVDDPGWATQMKFLAPTMIERIAEIVGIEIERVEVRVDQRHVRGQREFKSGSRRR